MSMQIISPRKRYDNGGIEPAVGKCYCGAKVELSDPLTNVCDSCGRGFNMSGQEIDPSYGRAECVRDGWAYDADDY